MFDQNLVMKIRLLQYFKKNVAIFSCRFAVWYIHNSYCSHPPYSCIPRQNKTE